MKTEDKMKKFFQDFKKFISRGNIVDMAVGVIVGSAFSAIVTSLTNKIIMPLINALLSIGGTNGLEQAYTFLRKVYEADGVTVDLTKSIYIDWGAFITAIINFFIIAFVLFSVLKAVMKANEMFKGAAEEMTNKELIAEKLEVRKQAKKDKIRFKKAWKAHLEEKKAKAEAEAKAKAEEEERLKAEEAEKARLNSTEYLLGQILELLKEQKTQEASKLLLPDEQSKVIDNIEK